MQRVWASLLLLLLAWPLLLMGQGSSQTSGQAVLLEITGVIGPASSEYIKRGLHKASQMNAAIVIIRIDTPGGLDTAMREIIQDFIASPIPVVTYVSPGGARAASAGTYMLYASHVAAMAPATNLGAATPVQLGPGGGQQDKTGDAMSKKMVNDAVAYIRGLAQMRGRNADWAEQAVREAASLSASAALKLNVIDLIAKDVPDLLVQLNGRKVNVRGQERVLATAGLIIQPMVPDWRSRVLSIITDPNIAYILMLIGIYGLIYEFANPGLVLPGVVGAVSLLLALLAFQVLPINYAGLALMALGIAFIIGELFLPSFGALGIGGVIAFAIGSVMLIDTDVPGYAISWQLIAVFTVLSAGFFLVVGAMAIKARQQPVVTGREQMIGSVGEVIESFNGEARIRIHGEIWKARSSTLLQQGQHVRVTDLQGLTLLVIPDKP